MKGVIARIHRLNITVEVRAGRATRNYKVVKSCGPDDLVFQSVHTGGAMRDNNVLCRHIKPAERKLGIGWVNWRCLRTSHATWLKTNPWIRGGVAFAELANHYAEHELVDHPIFSRHAVI